MALLHPASHRTITLPSAHATTGGAVGDFMIGELFDPQAELVIDHHYRPGWSQTRKGLFPARQWKRVLIDTQPKTPRPEMTVPAPSAGRSTGAVDGRRGRQTWDLYVNQIALPHVLANVATDCPMRRPAHADRRRQTARRTLRDGFLSDLQTAPAETKIRDRFERLLALAV